MIQDKFQDLAKEFLGYLYDIRGYSKHSIVTYEVALRQMLSVSQPREEETLYILDITPFRFAIVKQHKKTIVKKLSAIRSFVKYMQEQCTMDIKLIGDEAIKVVASLPKPIEEQYIKEVLAQSTIQEQLLLSMLYGLGLRISELSGLKLEAIKAQWVRIEGKGNKTRELPLLLSLYQLITRYRQSYAPKVYLFEKSEKPMNTAQLRYILTKVFKSHGLKVTPHQLRHSFATHLLNHGARIADVSELLGHETMATTQVYTKLGSLKKRQDYMKAHPLAKGD
ncbi:MAG: tyrosine-type recombinase/integrase [Sulfurovum sp.]|nr:tyrosine-type recombinase/integrase [Sulfurovum sp.]